MIRFAEEKDIEEIIKLLYQVHKVHSDHRPDLFVEGKKKYTTDELKEIIKDPTKPIFVDIENGHVAGYAFCVLSHVESVSMVAHDELYIDDLCVDQACRCQGIGKKIYLAVKEYAEEKHIYHITLNVWSFNESAKKFYESIGLKPLKIYMEDIIEK